MINFKLNIELSSIKYDVLIITESGLSCDNPELNLDDFVIYREDKVQSVASRGGGVLIAIRKNIKSFLCLQNDIHSPVFKQIFVCLPEYNHIISAVKI